MPLSQEHAQALRKAAAEIDRAPREIQERFLEGLVVWYGQLPDTIIEIGSVEGVEGVDLSDPKNYL